MCSRSLQKEYHLVISKEAVGSLTPITIVHPFSHLQAPPHHSYGRLLTGASPTPYIAVSLFLSVLKRIKDISVQNSPRTEIMVGQLCLVLLQFRIDALPVDGMFNFELGPGPLGSNNSNQIAIRILMGHLKPPRPISCKNSRCIEI
jgi:hypothetical protein